MNDRNTIAVPTSVIAEAIGLGNDGNGPLADGGPNSAAGTGATVAAAPGELILATDAVGISRSNGKGGDGGAMTIAAADAALFRFVPPTDAGSLADALVAGQLSKQTQRAYAADLAEILSVLEAWGLTLPQVTRDHLHAYRRWLAGDAVPMLTTREKPCAAATVSRKMSVVRQFFGEAFDRGLIPVNPAARVRGLTVGSGDSKTLGLSQRQAKAVLSSIDTSTLLGLRDRAMLSLMLRTGLRSMDVRQATCGSLGETQGHRILLVKASKGRKDRTVKLPTDVWRDVEAWRQAAGTWRVERADGSTPLFCGIVRSGRKPHTIYKVYGKGETAGQEPLSEAALWKVVVGRTKATGITENITPHSTRHTFITLALDGGAPLHKVQDAAGHADPRTTERYWRTKQNLDDNAVDYVKL